MSDSPKCPKCGYVMCETFDEVKQTDGLFGSSLMIPTGKYVCYQCGTEA